MSATSIVRDLGLERLHQLGDRRLRALAEADEDEAHPDFEVERHQAELGLVEIGEGARPGGAAQRAVEIVDPAVEGADQRVLAGALAVGDDAASRDGGRYCGSRAPRRPCRARSARARRPRPWSDSRRASGTSETWPAICQWLRKTCSFSSSSKAGAVIGPARQAAPVPIVGDRHVAKVRVHRRCSHIVEYSFNIDIFAVVLQELTGYSMWTVRSRAANLPALSTPCAGPALRSRPRRSGPGGGLDLPGWKRILPPWRLCR